MVKGILKQLKRPGRVPVSKGRKFCGVGLWDKSPTEDEGGKVVVKDSSLYDAFSLKRQCP